MKNENQPSHRTQQKDSWSSRKDVDDPDFFGCVLLLTAMFKPEIYAEYRRARQQQREEETTENVRLW
ncbi:hypothetical protein ACFLZQ_05270 [Thermodesulfobacteriota bacterium]